MKIIGHRGARGLAPENTLQAIRKGLEHSVDEIEVDAHVSKDGIPILVHDPVIHDAAGRPYRLADCSYQDLLAVNPDIATLGDALALVNRQVPFMIEVKPHVNVKPILEQIRALHKKGWQLPDITIASESYKILKTVRREMPDLTLSIVENWSGVRATWIARRLGITRLSMNYWSLWSGFTKPLARRGYQISSFTVNQPQTARRMRRIGVHGIFTDNPDIMKDI